MRFPLNLKDGRAQNPGWIHPVSHRQSTQRGVERCCACLAIKMTRLVRFLCSVHIARHRFFPGQRDFRYASSLLYNLRGGRRINSPMEYKVASLSASTLRCLVVRRLNSFFSRWGRPLERKGGGNGSVETIFHNKIFCIFEFGTVGKNGNIWIRETSSFIYIYSFVTEEFAIHPYRKRKRPFWQKSRSILEFLTNKEIMQSAFGRSASVACTRRIFSYKGILSLTIIRYLTDRNSEKIDSSFDFLFNPRFESTL